MPLSAAAKAALCICPPALMAGTVATVPPVKRAVYHLTASRQAPKPIRRVAAKARVQPQQVAAPRLADCDPGLGGITPAVPLVTYAAPIPDEPVAGSTSVLPSSGVPVVGAIGVVPTNSGGGDMIPPIVSPITPPVVSPITPPVVSPITPPVVSPTDPGTGAVPEPSVWLMMIAGVGTLGATLRRRRRAAFGGRNTARRTAIGGMLWSGSVAVEAGDMAATVAMKSVVASAAGKALLCVCPAAIVAGSVMTVPPLRQAVHAATVVSEPTVPVPVAAPIVALPPCNDANTVPVAATSIDGFPAAVGTTSVPISKAEAPAAVASIPASSSPTILATVEG